MNKKIRYFILPSLFILSFLLISWGNNGHYIISWNMPLSLPAEMSEFKDWNTYLAAHASDPDYRKGSDPTEGPKHYIDIDNYSEFIDSGSISQNLDTLIEKYGASFVNSQGYLPWATINTYDSLVVSFQNRDWEKAKYFAADLGHYVADGFMPLHITRNYDGQFTGNTGIHSRFESKMIARHKDDIKVNVTEIDSIEVIEDYIFNYMYGNIIYVDSIMAADNYGISVDANNTSTAYLDAMWEFSEGFTQKLFNTGTKAYSSLFYAAWVEAGKPMISTASIDNKDSMDDSDLSFFPNPVRDYATIRFVSNWNLSYELSLINSKGSVVKKIIDRSPPEENIELSWDLSNFEPGVYFLSLQNSERRISRKLLLSN